MLRVAPSTVLNVSAEAPGAGLSGAGQGSSPEAPGTGANGVAGAKGGNGANTNMLAGAGGAGASGGTGGNGGAGGTGGAGGAGSAGGNGLPGMLKLHGSVVLAGGAQVVAANAASLDPNHNGAYTVISNMTHAGAMANRPQAGTNGLVQGITSHVPYLTAFNPLVNDRTPVLPNIKGGAATRGWCLPNYWNDGLENPPFSSNNDLEYRVFRKVEGTSVFEGFDQVIIRNTNSSGQISGVGIVVGANPEVLIDGKNGTAGVLAAGESWTTAVPAGTYIHVPNASGSGPGDGPVAQFIASPTSGARNLAVQFIDQSQAGAAPIDSWLWSFGDGTTSTEQNPIHTYTTAGTYHVSLTVITALDTGVMLRSNYITVTEPVGPTALFSGGPTTITAGDTVYFGDSSLPGTAPVTAWAWDFGDGTTHAGQSPSHRYDVPGLYTVTLTVTTSVGSHTRTVPGYVQVSAPPLPVPPVSDFIASPLNVVIGQPVQFADLATPGSSPILGWNWTFGDGQTALLRSPSHVYNTPGVYDVSLTVVSDSGSDLHVKTGYITVAAPGGPTANFLGTPPSGTTPLTVTFNDLSLPGDEPITAWAWDFGDGGSASVPNPTYQYNTAGTYSVSLTVTTAVGSHTRVRNNYITATKPAAPTAIFNAMPSGGLAPLAVQFIDLSLPGGAPINAWLWQFGDGTTSTEASPSHVYNNPGSYTVQLTVSSAAGTDSETRAGFINVNQVGGPTADFTAHPKKGDSPLKVQFANASSAGDSPITSWLWHFGDGTTSTEQAPAHIYAGPGIYTVRLIVTDAQNASDEEQKVNWITVTQPAALKADFSASPQSGPAPLQVQFADMSSAGNRPVTSWLWDFGDGTISEDRHPQHLYEAEGSYTVSLTVSDGTNTVTETRDHYITVEGMLPAMGLVGRLLIVAAAIAAGIKAMRKGRG
ncbi:MAG TPA: PKD domain-containing protein [Candidatus Hydrogenedentes bacterium]|nr:PKD domain-containing protein [Candidatus Hydrogenedentota bacterium]